MCLLVGAINPNDLDAMDDSRPFTKFTLENVMGRGLTPQEYYRYWSEHPTSREYDYNRFATEQKHAADLIRVDSVTRKQTRYNGSSEFASGINSLGKILFG
jgi:hypothetical protein